MSNFVYIPRLEELLIAAGNSSIIGLASLDLIAAKAFYHGQCY